MCNAKRDPFTFKLIKAFTFGSFLLLPTSDVNEQNTQG